MLSPAGPAIAAAVYSLQPELFVRETYDDNVFRVNENRRDDFITTVGARLALTARSPRFAASADYRLGVDFFAKSTQDQGQMNHRGLLSTSYVATRRLTLRLGDEARFARTTVPDATVAALEAPPAPVPGPVAGEPPPAVEPGAIPTRRVRRFDNTAAAGFGYQYDAYTALDGEYLFRIARFDAADLVDMDTHRVRASVTRQVALHDRVGAAYTFSWIRFEEPVRNDHLVHEVMATWGHEFSPSLTGELGAGVVWTTNGDTDLGVAARAALTKHAGLTRYSATYRGTFTTSGGTGVVHRSDSVALGVSRELSSRLTGQVGAAVSRSKPVEDSSGPTYTYSAAAGLVAQLTNLLRGGLTYSFERTDAPVAADSFHNNQVTVGLTLLLPALGTTGF